MIESVIPKDSDSIGTLFDTAATMGQALIHFSDGDGSLEELARAISRERDVPYIKVLENLRGYSETRTD